MRRRARVTAKDVGKLANVSPSTVSRVLSGKGILLISDETIARVKEAAKTLGYSPDPIARALRGEKTYLLGLIVREIADPFFSSFISILSSQARDLGYQILLSHAHSDPAEALELTAVLDTRHCDGVLILGDLRDDEIAFHTILQHEKAVVGLCRGHAPGSLYTVNPDNELGIRLLFEHLISLKHKRIAYLDGGWLGDIRERRDAFIALANEFGLDLPSGYVRIVSNDLSGGYQGATELLRLPEPPTAIIASDDIMAIGVMKAILSEGFRVPQDISVVGFDDITFASFVSPALTTVQQPIEEMSRQALRLLLDLIEAETRPNNEKLIRIKPNLMIRESTMVVKEE